MRLFETQEGHRQKVRVQTARARPLSARGTDHQAKKVQPVLRKSTSISFRQHPATRRRRLHPL